MAIFTFGAIGLVKATVAYTAKKYAVKTGFSFLKNAIAHSGTKGAATKIGHGVAQEVSMEASRDFWDFIGELL